MNFRTIKSTFWNPLGVYWKESKRVGGQILGWRFNSKQVPKRCSLLAADISMPFPGWNFQTARDLKLQEGFLENRLLELSFRCCSTPFGQVFWKLCSLEVKAAKLKSTDSFYFYFCTCYFLVPPSPYPFGRLFWPYFSLVLLIVRPINMGWNSACKQLWVNVFGLSLNSLVYLSSLAYL